MSHLHYMLPMLVEIAGACGGSGGVSISSCVHGNTSSIHRSPHHQSKTLSRIRAYTLPQSHFHNAQAQTLPLGLAAAHRQWLAGMRQHLSCLTTTLPGVCACFAHTGYALLVSITQLLLLRRAEHKIR